MKIKILFFSVLIVLLVTGSLIGLFSGNIMKKQFFANQGRFSLIFTLPSNEFLNLYTLLYSPNQYNRVTAYYTLKDLNIVDISFLLDRYKIEKAIFIKKIILMVIASSEEKKLVLKTLLNLYKEADIQLKEYILTIINQLDYKLYTKLLKESDPKLKAKFSSESKLIYQQSIIF